MVTGNNTRYKWESTNQNQTKWKETKAKRKQYITKKKAKDKKDKAVNPIYSTYMLLGQLYDRQETRTIYDIPFLFLS